MTVDSGHTYTGEDGTRRIILSIEGDTVNYRTLIGGTIHATSREVFETWAVSEYGV